MEQFSLGLAEHLLLWVFPLALVVLVVMTSVRDASRESDSP